MACTGGSEALDARRVVSCRCQLNLWHCGLGALCTRQYCAPHFKGFAKSVFGRRYTDQILSQRKFGKADLLCLLIVMIWGANMSVVKHALREFEPIAFNALRLILSALILFGIARFVDGRVPIDRSDWGRLLLLGIIGNTLYQGIFIVALDWTKAGNAAMLLAAITVFTALLSRLRGHERLSPLGWVGIAVSISGVFLIIRESTGIAMSGSTLAGDLLMVVTALCWAIYTVASKRLMKTYPPITFTSVTFAIGALVYAVLALPWALQQNWLDVSWQGYFELVYSGAFGLSLAYSLWFAAVKEIGGTRVSVYNSLTPFFGVLVAALFLAERFTVLQLLGGVLIFFGIFLNRRARLESGKRNWE